MKTQMVHATYRTRRTRLPRQSRLESGMVCPICKREVDECDPRLEKLIPFCSERCKLIDLGRWLSGKYQIPVDDSVHEPDVADDRQ